MRTTRVAVDEHFAGVDSNDVLYAAEPDYAGQVKAMAAQIGASALKGIAAGDGGDTGGVWEPFSRTQPAMAGASPPATWSVDLGADCEVGVVDVPEEDVVIRCCSGRAI